MAIDYRYKIKRFLFQDFIPVTKTVALLTGIVFVLHYVLVLFRFNLMDVLVLDGRQFLLRPWTLLSYCLTGGDFLNLLFAVLWLWFVGGNLERTWGSRSYALFFILLTGFTGLVMALVAMFFLPGIIIPYNGLHGLWLPLVGLTWAWAKLYPDQEMLFFGIIPIQARWLAWLDAAIIFYTYLSVAPLGYGWLLALASLSGIPVANFYFNNPFSGQGRSNRWKKEMSSNRWGTDPKKKSGRKRFRVIK